MGCRSRGSSSRVRPGGGRRRHSAQTILAAAAPGCKELKPHGFFPEPLPPLADLRLASQRVGKRTGLPDASRRLQDGVTSSRQFRDVADGDAESGGSAAVYNYDPFGAPMPINKFLYFSDFFAIPVMMLVFAWLAFRSASFTAVAPDFFLSFVIGALAWTLAEYLIHRYAYHHAPLLSPLHDAHHQKPNEFIGAPSFVSIPILVAAGFLPLYPFDPGRRLWVRGGTVARLRGLHVRSPCDAPLQDRAGGLALSGASATYGASLCRRHQLWRGDRLLGPRLRNDARSSPGARLAPCGSPIDLRDIVAAATASGICLAFAQSAGGRRRQAEIRTLTRPSTPFLDRIRDAADIRKLPPSDLRQLADELRAETISAVSVTGGHLGAGLGVVELTVALHYVFDTPRDRLIWDVGHQAYPHKILTGRRDRIRTLRQGGGLSGFTRRAESGYDPFGAGHSSTSISAGLGMAVARDLDAPRQRRRRGDRRRRDVGGHGL